MYGLDQLFLAQEIYPKIKNDVLIHTDLVKFGNEKVMPFPSKRENNNFVGEVITSNFNDTKSKIDLNLMPIKKYLPAVFYYKDNYITVLKYAKKLVPKLKRVRNES